MNLTLPTRRNLTLELLIWAADDYVHCEARYFEAAVRCRATHSRRDRLQKARWREKAHGPYGWMRDDVDDLSEMGLREAAVDVVLAAGLRVREARLAYLEAGGLDPTLARRIRLAVEIGGPG